MMQTQILDIETQDMGQKKEDDQDQLMSPSENLVMTQEGALKEQGPDGLNMSAMKENGDKQLVLTPRRVSGREKKSISYNKLHTGAADSDDEDMEGKENALGGSMSKDKFRKDMKPKLTLQEITKKVRTLFDFMKSHPHAALFNQNLSPDHPIYDEVKSNFLILNLIVLNFSLQGHYKNTDEIADDFRKMVLTRTKMSIIQGSPEESDQIQQFHQAFEEQFKELGLEGLSLTKQPDSSTIANKTGKVDQQPQQKLAANLKRPTIPAKPKPNVTKPQKPGGINAPAPVAATGPVRIHTDPQQRAMTQEEKAELRQNIQKITQE